MRQREGKERERESAWEWKEGADLCQPPENSQKFPDSMVSESEVAMTACFTMKRKPIFSWSYCSHMVGQQPEVKGQCKGPGEEIGGELNASAPWVYKAGWERTRPCSGEVLVNEVAGPMARPGTCLAYYTRLITEQHAVNNSKGKESTNIEGTQWRREQNR